ncbi:MAG TPA: MarR family winged helix-turn-helix transcriptional regulator [Phnomibacter sp.]|nr:MarR family winged helix-turn-helix transcriptional regulator [Phnomibacter sp.]
MPNNQFRRGELYFVITGVANTALARRLQRYFREEGIELTVEQWSVLVHLWKEDGVSQQELCNRTYRDKPSITRLVDNMERQGLVERVASPTDRRINLVYLTETGRNLKDITVQLANKTLLDGLEGVSAQDIEVTRRVLTQVYENLNLLPVEAGSDN